MIAADDVSFNVSYGPRGFRAWAAVRLPACRVRRHPFGLHRAAEDARRELSRGVWRAVYDPIPGRLEALRDLAALASARTGDPAAAGVVEGLDELLALVRWESGAFSRKGKGPA